jgi:lysophospholipase L1-like esterase
VVADLRVCFVGDSFVAGVGDPEHVGWVGRILTRTEHAGQSLTAYNLGIRRDTSEDVLARWDVECARRLPAGCAGMLVVSVGVNDAVIENGQPRVAADHSATNLATLLSQAAREGWSAMVIGPAPVADPQHNRRISDLNERFEQVCGGYEVCYVDVFSTLRDNPTWMHQVENGDGAHPSAEGYSAYAELVWPHWSTWITRVRGG